MKQTHEQSEQEFLAAYNASEYDRPSVAVDTVIFTVIDHELHVLTVKRAEHPFRGHWSLIGGYIDVINDADLETTAKRKLCEKTGVRTPYLEQFGVIGNKQRDPRGWAVTVVYFALISAQDITLSAGTSASDIKWAKVQDGAVADPLAFDHGLILASCVARLRAKVLYTSLPVYLMPPEFSLGELQSVYEIILSHSIDHKSFRRRMLAVDLLEETGTLRHDGSRPAKLYRVKPAQAPHIFTRTIEASC